ncbi:MAG: DUF5681 domain-containing protein [Gammaproteobacteria bacterium]
MAFEPGKSGNPKGRPNGSLNKNTQFIKLLESHTPALINKCVELALEGNEACLRLALDKILPKAKTQALSFEVPDKLSTEFLIEMSEAIWHKIGNGEVTLEQAKDFFTLLKIYKNIAPNSSPNSLIEMLIDKLDSSN